MSYKKHLQVVPMNQRLKAQLAKNRDYSDSMSGGSSANYSSVLPEVYEGSPMRIDRYGQYDEMDSDSDVNAALDIIATFSTQKNSKTDEVFNIKYRKEASETEIEILRTCLFQWSKVNNFKQRAWRIFRNVLKYGDVFFIRDPETLRWFYVDATKVDKVLVNEAEGKQPEAYIFSDLDVNLNSFTATAPDKYGQNLVGGASQMSFQKPTRDLKRWGKGANNGSRFEGESSQTAIEATHVIHLSLSEGLDANWPFGTSILESVFKVWREKGLLEQAVIIYRIQRAPERRVFYVDVGGMPLHRVGGYLEKVKNEIHQRRFPSRTGGGANVGDATYNPMCLDLSTRIPLLDGRTLSLNELITEKAQGKENWVYSCDPITGAILPGNITWAGVTRRDAQVIKLTFDNGETLTCTPDHKIPILGQGFVEAQDIKADDSLVAFNRDYKSLGSNAKNTYERVYDHSRQEWVFTHRMVAEFFENLGKHQTFTFSDDLADAIKDTVHHADYDRHNNDPRNLKWMNFIDHRLYHSHVKKEWWQVLSSDRALEIKESIRTSLKATRARYTDEDRLAISRACKAGQDARWQNTNRESAEFLDTREKISEARREYLAANPDAVEQLRENFREQQAKPWENTRFTWSPEMIKYLVYRVKDSEDNLETVISSLNHDSQFMDMLLGANPDCGVTGNLDNTKFTLSKLKILFKQSGFKGWKDFRDKTRLYNHKVTSIEWLHEPMDVGTITVDGQERWHKHHTFAIESGIFVKNSMMEDFFFAQSAEGRGSRVDTLPAGENLGQIDDLRYWDNKVLRGLRVPSSYLPSGPEDGMQTFSDGRVGTAYIQEFSFAQYCQRLQNLISPIFDDEFKLFVKQRGFTNIDVSMFELNFNEPENFGVYAKMERTAAAINIYTPLAEMKQFSKRWLMINMLGMTEEEINDNETMWREENRDLTKNTSADDNFTGTSPAGMESIGIRPQDDMDLDIDDGDTDDQDSEEPNASPISGEENSDSGEDQ